MQKYIYFAYFLHMFLQFWVEKKYAHAKNMQKQIFGDGPSVVLWPKDFSKPNSKEHPPGTYSNLP